MGFAVATVAQGQAMDGGPFNRLAHQLAKLTGKRPQYRDPGFAHAHIALREELLETFAHEEAMP
ncbi:hypothetical protein [Eggerthella timonensis]|uniref:hypothetical protein n=1 Tax=Eggerthella timonensis TaxID=1871008 RepID=UPI000C7778EB|nr:hypothetical protein [Eggerthella timonensis]